MKNSFVKNINLSKSLNSNILISTANNIQPFLSVSTDKSSESIAVKKFESIPGPKPSLPLIGTGWQYFKYSKLLIDISGRFSRRGNRTLKK